MKISLIPIFISIILTSCSSGKYVDTIKGSWYNLNSVEKVYEEIHIDDSLVIYCYNNCDVLLTFHYSLKKDSIYLFFDEMDIKYRYKILMNESNDKVMTLIDKEDKLFFRKMDEIYDNLNNLIVDFESLDSLSRDYHSRKKRIMNSN